MDEIMRELYCIVDDRVGQGYGRDEETKALEERKYALQDEIVRRIGSGGQELMEVLADLSLKLEDIHDEALFRAAVSLGAEMAGPRWGMQATGASGG